MCYLAAFTMAPLPQLWAWANGAAQDSTDNIAFDSSDFTSFYLSRRGPVQRPLQPGRLGNRWQKIGWPRGADGRCLSAVVAAAGRYCVGTEKAPQLSNPPTKDMKMRTGADCDKSLPRWRFS